MAHKQKYTKNVIGHMFSHYDRSKEIPDLPVPTNTFLNYNLAENDQPKNQVDFLHQRLSEVKVHNRKDINVIVDWVVTVPKNFPINEQEKFFSETYNFLNNRYGKENVISAYVHKDEITPHMHYAFVPVVEDKRNGGYKLSAKEAVTRDDLRTFHGDLSKYLEEVFGYDVGVLNEATKEGNKSIKELKREAAQEKLKELQKSMEYIERRINDLEGVFSDKEKSLIKAYENKKNALEDKLEGLQRQIKGTELKINEINSIQPQKTITGTIKGVTVDDIENLKKTALVSIRALSEVKNLSQENDHLKCRVNSLEKKVPSIMEQIKERKEKEVLLEKANAFDRLSDNIKRELMFKTQEKSKDLEHRR